MRHENKLPFRKRRQFSSHDTAAVPCVFHSPGVSSATARKTSTSSIFIFLVWTLKIASLPAASGTSTLTIRSNLSPSPPDRNAST